MQADVYALCNKKSQTFGMHSPRPLGTFMMFLIVWDGRGLRRKYIAFTFSPHVPIFLLLLTIEHYKFVKHKSWQEICTFLHVAWFTTRSVSWFKNTKLLTNNIVDNAVIATLTLLPVSEIFGNEGSFVKQILFKQN